MRFLRNCMLTGLACICLFVSPLKAQDKKYLKFGNVDPDELSMQSYAADPEAGAVILFETEHVFFDFVKEKFQIVYEIHRRIKILSSSEIGQADIEIPFYSADRLEEVVSLKGMTYNLEDGNIVEYKLEKEAIFEDNPNEYVTVKKFAMPNVKEGSVIEYSYRINSRRTGYVPSWYFQHAIPTRMSQLMVDIPEGFNFNRMYLGEPVDDFTVEDGHYKPDFIDVGGSRYIYTGKTIPAMKEEPFTSSISNYVGRLKLELTGIYLPRFGLVQEFNTSWQVLTDNLLKSESYKSYLDGRKDLLDLLVQTRADAKDPSTFLPAVHRLVQQTTRWNGNRGYYPNPRRKELLDSHEGNGAAINLLLVALLQEAGYKAYPALLSTRAHGATQTFSPMLDQFNHLIAYVAVDDRYMLMDATDPFCPMGTLPYADLNGQCFILDGRGDTWANLSSEGKMGSTIRGSIVIGENGSTSGELAFVDKGYEAVSWRKYLYRNDNDEALYLEKRITEDVADAEITDIKLENRDTLYKPMTTKCEIATAQYGQQSGDFLYIQPLLFGTIEENPFKNEKRNYPVEFGAGIEERITLTLTIPEGYEIETVPEPTRVVLPGKVASFIYNTAVIGNNIQVMSVLQVDKVFFLPEEYADLRAFYEYVINKHAEQLVLKKKS